MTTTTGFRDMHAVESQKQRYSRELAAYTLRQWDVARQAMENGETGENMDAPMHPSSRDSNRPSKPAQGVQVIDYALRSRNGSRHEGEGRSNSKCLIH